MLLSSTISCGQSCDVFNDMVDCDEDLDISLVEDDDRAIFSFDPYAPRCKGSLKLELGQR